MAKKILVTGAGGFIGGHVVKRLLDQGHQVRACDIKPLDKWFQLFNTAENIVGDCELKEVCESITKDIDEVISLSFLMGGMEMICNNQANCILSSLINLQTIKASVKNGVKKFFNASSACSYPTNLQDKNEVVYLKESDAWPALPEVGYGMAKLFDEETCRLVMKDMGLSTYVARFFNVYGPYGTWDGGKEKAPAALCRKVAKAKLSGDLRIDIGGDGTQLRNFTYISDTVTGILKLMESDHHDPINLGSSEVVTINQLVTLIEEIAGVKLARNYLPNFPTGVHSRNTDNTLIKSVLGWEPSVSLREGLEKTYHWIEGEIRAGRSGE